MPVCPFPGDTTLVTWIRKCLPGVSITRVTIFSFVNNKYLVGRHFEIMETSCF